MKEETAPEDAETVPAERLVEVPPTGPSSRVTAAVPENVPLTENVVASEAVVQETEDAAASPPEIAAPETTTLP